MTDNFSPLKITQAVLRDSIINDTPLYTQRLLMELNPAYWSQFFDDGNRTLTGVKKPVDMTHSLRVLKDVELASQARQ